MNGIEQLKKRADALGPPSAITSPETEMKTDELMIAIWEAIRRETLTDQDVEKLQAQIARMIPEPETTRVPRIAFRVTGDYLAKEGKQKLLELCTRQGIDASGFF